MEGESEGQKLYSGEDVKRLSEYFGKIGWFRNMITNNVSDMEGQIAKIEIPEENFFLNIGKNYKLVDGYKTAIEQNKTEVSELRTQFEEDKEDLISIYGEFTMGFTEKSLYETLDEEHGEFDAYVENYEKLIKGLDFKELFKNQIASINEYQLAFKNDPVTKEGIKRDLLDFKVIIPVSEGSEELMIAEPYGNLEELKKYL